MLRRFVVCLALAAPVLAQDPPPREGEQKKDGPTEEQPLRTRGGPPWANSNWTGEAVEFLGRELDLDPGQKEKVKAILDEQVRDAFRDMARFWDPERGGPPDYDRMRTAMEDVRIKVAEKINEVLTPEQRREFETLVDQFDQRAQGFEQRRRASEDPTELFDPPPLSRRLTLAKAERALFLGPDETVVVMQLVARVVDLRIALGEGRKTRRDDLRSAIAAGASDAEVRQRLDVMRQAEEFQRLELLAAERELRDVLTVEQEVRFVAMGILD